MKENEQLEIPGISDMVRSSDKKFLGTEERYSDYASFVKKFKGKDTTDECYTPQNLYDALLEYFRKNIIGERNVVRPFYPDGDYKKYDYKDGDVVFDNPPFSIYTQICKWYTSRGIDFIIFAQTNTMCMVNVDDVTYIITDQKVIYENGAKVSTSFVTNMIPKYRFIIDAELSGIMHKWTVSKERKLVKKEYDEHLTSSAMLRKLASSGINLFIPKDECRIVDNFDVSKAAGIDMFGKGVILSDGMVKRMQEEVEACGYKNNTELPFLVYPSEKEKNIIRELSKNQ